MIDIWGPISFWQVAPKGFSLVDLKGNHEESNNSFGISAYCVDCRDKHGCSDMPDELDEWQITCRFTSLQ